MRTDIYINEDSINQEVFSKQKYQVIKHEQYMKMGHLRNIQSFEICIDTGNLQRYDEQSIVSPKPYNLQVVAR